MIPISDFDFLVGSWDVASRRLKELLAGSNDWDEFPGTSKCIRLFGGAANLDEFNFPAKGFSGLTLRLLDTARQEWWLYWANSRDGRLQPPVHGQFRNGAGFFYGDDTYQGKNVRVRYIWSEITPISARWEQAFSIDDERTWETNWVMKFTRQRRRAR